MIRLKPEGILPGRTYDMPEEKIKNRSKFETDWKEFIENWSKFQKDWEKYISNLG